MRNVVRVTWAHDWASMLPATIRLRGYCCSASSPSRISAYAEIITKKMSPDAELVRTATDSSNHQHSVIAEDQKLVQVLRTSIG